MDLTANPCYTTNRERQRQTDRKTDRQTESDRERVERPERDRE